MYLKLAAAGGLLKLARHKRYDDKLSPPNFQLLSSLVEDPEPEVRAAFLKKLFNGLKTFQLPLKYLAFFALMAKETKKDILANVCVLCTYNVLSLHLPFMLVRTPSVPGSLLLNICNSC